MISRLVAGFWALAIGIAGLSETPAPAEESAQLMVQLGHSGGVYSVAFSPDGRYVVTSSMDNTAVLWDVQTGWELRRFVGHTQQVRSVAFSPDGRTVLTGGWDNSARIWNVETGREVQQFADPSSITSVCFSPDGRSVLLGDLLGAARLLDIATGKEIQHFAGTTDPVTNRAFAVTSVAFSRDGRRVLTGSWDKTARLWDVKSGKELRQFTGHTNWVLSVAFSPDGRRVLTGGQDSTARMWDAASGKELTRFEGLGLSVESVAFSPDGHFVVTGNYDGTAHVWDAATGKEIRRIEWQSASKEKAIMSVAFSPDGRTVLTGSQDHSVRLWDPKTGNQTRLFDGRSGFIYSASFSPDGHSVLTGNQDNVAHLWDLEEGKEVQRFVGHENEVRSVAFSRNGLQALTGSSDGTARLWDKETGKEVQQFGQVLHGLMSGTQVYSVAISPDGRSVLTGGADKTARLWAVESGKELHGLEGHSSAVLAAAISPDGSRLITGGLDGTVRLWDPLTGKEIERLPGLSQKVTSVAFSPDGQSVVAGGWEFTVRQWSLESGKELQQFVGHDLVNSVAFSPDGQRVLTSGADSNARIWDVATGKELLHFPADVSFVSSASFSPDGRMIITCNSDGTVRLWDPESGKQLVSFISYQNGDWAVVDPEGRFDTNDLDGDAPLHWIVSDEPMRALPLEIFMSDYYTPRLLARIVNHEKLPPVRSIAQVRNRVQPGVSIVSVGASKAHPGRADVVVHAETRKDERGTASGLQDLRLFRNGQLVANTPLNQTLATGDFKFNNIQLPASIKNVTFTAYAFNSDRIKSPTAEMNFAYEPVAGARRRAFLLQIGVNHYEAQGCELHGSVNDAEELSRVLAERLRERGLDLQLPILLLSDATQEGATKQRMHEELAKIAAAAAPDDVFFLSFSGHGYGDQTGQFYIFPADIQGSCREVNATLLKNAISADELAEWLRPIDAGEMTFVLDSCQSASSVEANDFKPGPMGNRGLGQLAYDKRMRILAASQGNQEAKETNLLSSEDTGGEKTRGLLSFALTDEGLVEGKADWKPVDGKITVGEWLAYAADAVPKSLEAGEINTGRGLLLLAEKPGVLKAAQIPSVFDFSKTDDFVLQEGASAGR